ncbi:hypothetical protein H0H93_001898, partial [Arthromyces matolae]
MLARPLSRAASPIPPSNFLRYGSDHLALNPPKPPSSTHAEFEIERISKTPNPQQSVPMAMQGYENTAEFRDYVLQLLEATTAPFTVSGRFRLEATQLTLFFRTKAGITHSLDFPVDVDYSLPPSLEVLIATSRPHGTVDY